MPRRKKKRRGRPRKNESSGLTSGRLASDLRAYYRDLERKCNEVQTEMSAIGEALAALGGEAPAAKRGPGRPKGSGKRKPGRPKGSTSKSKTKGAARRGPRPAGTSLKDHLEKVLKASANPVGVKDLTSKVQRSGYKTKSKNLSNQISMALSQMVNDRQAKKVSRGMYAA